MATPPSLRFRFFTEKTDGTQSTESPESEPPRSQRRSRLDARRAWLESELELMERTAREIDAA